MILKMNNAGTWRSGTISTLLLLLGWLLIGASALLIRYSRSLFDTAYAASFFWEYLVPPILVGGPMAFLDTWFFRPRLKGRSFIHALALRFLIFVGGIILTYGAIGFLVLGYRDKLLFAYIFHFLLLWGLGSIFLLAVRNLAEHFDRHQLLKWLTGAYHRPMVEERIFLFVDLNDSTSIAEKLGPKAYFNFLSDYFFLTAEVIEQHEGEIYQHVGDEIIVTWPLHKGLRRENAYRLFFALEETLKINRDMFQREYGIFPEIKGSLHAGSVTKGEIRGKRREFIFTGDVLNSAARMHGVCKENDVQLIVSGDMLQKSYISSNFRIRSLGAMLFRGKEKPVDVYAVDQTSAVM
ncbi:adenylate/guanylate cyclase domain-containing protein [Fulvivirga sedimenti]|uniref:Adenylate/guanylate cyclase domain-containing protein n=1 Tax=Fulvivirga sedimenti TaxID=2879465 RepID=A0A9X1HP31_9BACT|nr:adenylate/guanylate cyclase domain-containing protein [Fulvivirga sedimenti]MCA6073567.1 adenylate/guanylate cyclase domain-containing protein [Fulvivirga sedimenti]